MRVFIAISLLLFLLFRVNLSEENQNNRPIIGITAQPYPENADFSLISASYVKVRKKCFFVKQMIILKIFVILIID